MIISSLLVWLWDWHRADPICSLMISILIGASVIPLLTSTARTLLQKTPKKFEQRHYACMQKVCFRLNLYGFVSSYGSQIKSLAGVRDVNESHFWMLTHGQLVGTVHILVEDDANEQRILREATAIFKKYGVSQITIQTNKSSATASTIPSFPVDPAKLHWTQIISQTTH